GRLHQEHGAGDSVADAHADPGLRFLRRLLVGDAASAGRRRRAGEDAGEDQPARALPARPAQAHAAVPRQHTAQDHPLAVREHLRAHVRLRDHDSRGDTQLRGDGREPRDPGRASPRGPADRRRQKRHGGVPGGRAVPAARRAHAARRRGDRRSRRGAEQRELLLQPGSARVDRQGAGHDRARAHDRSRGDPRLGDALGARPDLRRHFEDQDLMLPDKRLLYLTSHELVAYLWKRGELVEEATFKPGDEGAASFSEYVSRASDSLFHIVADLVEEDFFQENIPYLRGGDRRALLARKLAQRYRDTSLAVTLSLGTEIAGRREERILYASFTNTQQFQPWLGSLRAIQARIAGVYSIAMLAPLLCRRVGVKSRQYMVVSLQEAGLRQTYVDNGTARFSRLSKVDRDDSNALADACAAESTRFHQYLLNSRILSRESTTLDVVVLAPGESRSLYEAACVSNAQLRFRIVDLDSARRAAGLRSAPGRALAESLYLHVAARARFAAQFADDALRRFYDLWRTQVALVLSGATVFAV